MPSFKGYPGINPSHPFPASVCISIDNEIVHGIPGDRKLREGQVVSVDAGAIVDGWHGDGARTFYVGEPPPRVRQLIDLTRDAMLAGIAAAVPGNHIEDISAAVQDVAAAAGFGVIRQFVGHGIGTGHARGAAGPQLPDRPGRAQARAGHLPGDRADVHARRATTRGSCPTTGRSSPATARWPPISSIRSPSPPTDRRS